MNIDWVSQENTLILNPRLGADDRARMESAWRDLIDGTFRGQIGIATSGSSGDPRGRLIVIARAALLVNALSVNEHLQATAKDVWLKTLPSFHVGGLGIHARAHLSRSRVIESALERWDAEAFHSKLELSGATLLSLVPTQVYDLVSANLRAPKALRAVIIGGGRLDRDLYLKARELAWPVHLSYGLTECSSQVATSARPEDPRLFPLGHAEIRLSESGAIAIRSAALLTGQIVWHEDRAHFVDPKDHGWFQTEDRGRIESDASITVFGRAADFVKIGGEGVSLPRLEDRLAAVKSRLGLAIEAAVLAAADERLGARVVLLTDAALETANALAEKFNREVMPFERIRSVHVLTELPKSPLGKLLRVQALTQAGLKPVADL